MMHGHSFKVWWLVTASPVVAATIDAALAIVLAVVACAVLAHGWKP